MIGFSRSVSSLRLLSSSTSVRACMGSAVASQQLNASLSEADPVLTELISRENLRQKNTVNLIPSENYMSVAANQAVGSIMNSKYSEGLPLNRYYGGNKLIDEMEMLCQRRALHLFGLNAEEWGINVQPHSLTPANFHVLTGILGNHDRLMSLAHEHGGHLSHGQNVQRKKLSAASVFFEVLNYRINEKSGLIDYERLEEQAKEYMPKVIFGGADLYSGVVDYERLRKICDQIGALLVVDLGQVAGLVASKILPSPFPFADVVTSATHKSLGGPRGALVFYNQQGKKGLDLKNRIENAIFPGSQGGPHNHTISGIAVALKEADSAAFHQYSQSAVANAKTLATFFTSSNLPVLTNSTTNNLVLLDLRSTQTNPEQLVRLLEALHLDAHRVAPTSKTTFLSQFLSLGSNAMTTRGCSTADFTQMGNFILQAINHLKQQQSTNAQDKFCATSLIQSNQSLEKLQKEVLAFAHAFPVPGAN